MDWRIGSEIRGAFDFLGSLYGWFNSIYVLFMKDFAVTGRRSWIFQFFQIFLSSSISDTLIRSHEELMVDNFFGELYCHISGRHLDTKMTGERINEPAYLQI
jgi:hypothetical protein